MSTPSYLHIFNLLDFADDLTTRILAGDPDNSSYFLTLVYIEDILDSYGRSFVPTTAREAGCSEDEAQALKNEAASRMDALRHTLSELVNTYDFDRTMDEASRRFASEWHKRPA